MVRRMGSVLVSVFFVALILGIHGFVYRLLVANQLLVIREVVVEGNHYLLEEEILHLTGLRPGMGIFDFSWDVVISRLTNRAYIRWAEGERVLPWRVKIKIEENLPVGVVVIGTNAFFIDREGNLMVSARAPQVPRIDVSYPLVLEKGRIQDEWLLSVVKYLGKLTNLERVERISLERKTGAHVWLRSMPTDIWVGHEVLNEEVWERIFALEQEITEKKLTFKTINLHKENAIGYQ
ncbi:cell division protein FtsQ/DivIB [Thermospira aquatica]|uniref:FtsQ-type POTRA domain-containing protein n=1 Tax=Thermospira aquatica TaxID=2828656 RepID=A0AAX3BCX5_9SPIR|nr:FtsQ-type POTRA domain-containing protein [Thermospira aquatica]URA10020.1 FtsQ-type POTRA domain-containing protein [Thermospira aquatica]